MPRPRTYASEHPAVYECSTVCRDAQVEERADDLRPARKSEVQIWEQKFLVGKNEKIIAEYIRNQLNEDYDMDQMSMKEFRDPFTGEKRK